MKKSIALLMAVIFVALLSACKAEETPEAPSGQSETGQSETNQSENTKKFPMELYSDENYTLTALSYGIDGFGDYGLELKLENNSEVKSNLNYDGYMIANGYAITGSIDVNTEPGETETGWLNLNDENVEIRGLVEADIVELKVQFEVYLPDTGDEISLGDGYTTIQFGDFSEDKIPAASVGTQVVMDRDGILVKLVKSEVDWTGSKVYYLCIENNTDKAIDFSTYSATINGTSQCEVFGKSNFPIPAGTKSVEDISIDADDLAEINLTPETVTSITTAFRFSNEDYSMDFISDDITINE